MQVAIPPTVVYRELDDAIVVMSLESGEYASLSDVGARIWTIAAATPAVDAVCAALASEYGTTPDECRDDVLAFLEELAAKRLVTLVTGG